MKVYELAKEIGLSSKDAVDKLNKGGMSISSHLASLSDEQEKLARSILTGATPPPATSAKKERKYKFDNDHNYIVRSNVYGQLIYVNHKNGDTTTWDDYNDIQVMSGQDIADMRGGQSIFFDSNWITIMGDEDDESATPEDIYKSLHMEKYYTQYVNTANFSEVLKWTDADIKNKISTMSINTKRALVVLLNELISNGRLDSIRKIRLFEECLDCELLDLV